MNILTVGGRLAILLPLSHMGLFNCILPKLQVPYFHDAFYSFYEQNPFHLNFLFSLTRLILKQSWFWCLLIFTNDCCLIGFLILLLIVQSKEIHNEFDVQFQTKNCKMLAHNLIGVQMPYFDFFSLIMYMNFT